MTAKLGDSVKALLLADGTVIGFIGDKLEPNKTKQTVQPPFVIYKISDTDPTNTKDGVSPLDTERLVFSIFSDDYDEVHDIGEAIRSVLDRFSGSSAGMDIDKYIFDDKQDFFDEPSQLENLEMDYRVRIKRS